MRRFATSRVVAQHNLHEVQEGLGQTGRFGEIFVGLALIMLAGGAALLGVMLSGFFDGSVIDTGAANGDALILTIFLFVMALGFGTFGVLAILSGWARHHDDFSW